jgi:GNAT superfamily N-acetyltransferase
MPFHVRPTAEADYPRILAIQNDQSATAADLEQYRRQMAQAAPDERRLRLVAATADGLVVGMAGVLHNPRWDAPGRYFGRIRVDRAWRGRGAGGALLTAVLQWCRAEGASRLDSELPEDDPAGIAWAERHGFVREWLVFDSVLDLTAWRPEPFQPNLRQAEAQGIRFSTLDAEARGPKDLRRYYDLRKRIFADVPVVGRMPFGPYEEWLTRFLRDPDFDGNRLTLAIHGDAWVGLTELEPGPAGGFENGLTGVDSAWRGRGVALALKTVSLTWAREQGAGFVLTHNHSANAPMLAINRRLGYRPRPGRWQCTLSL